MRFTVASDSSSRMWPTTAYSGGSPGCPSAAAPCGETTMKNWEPAVPAGSDGSLAIATSPLA